MEFELTADGDITAPGPPPTEPCESCGTPVQLVCVVALVRLFAGLPETAEAPKTWMEYRTVADTCRNRTARGALQMRPHTPARCQLVRLGAPEPWSDPDEWDDE